jgi:hypothetical protein
VAEYLQIPPSLLREDEFRELTAAQQHAFLTLCLRPEHGASGMLHAFYGRWAYATQGLSALEMLDSVRHLALTGWVVLDEAEDEAFVCRFMDFNNVAKNPNRLRLAISETANYESPLVLSAMGDALAEIKRADARKAAAELRSAEPKPLRPRLRRGIHASIRTAVYERDIWRCVYCGLQFEPAAVGAPENQELAIWLELDHKKPYSMGGDDTVENLRAACSTCNRRRGVDDLDLWADKIGVD